MIIHETKTINLNLDICKEATVEDYLGSGGFGDVWKIREITTNKYYALKHIRLKIKEPGKLAKFVLRMSNEAKIKIESPYIVESYGLTRFDDLNYGILYEYIDGKEMGDWIKEDGSRLSWDIKKEIFIKILNGVNAAHKKEVIHKDLKPENIFISKDNIPKIIDFGLAKTKDQNITESKELTGTLPYMAPESMVDQEITKQFDIFSLGCILYFLIRGKNYCEICSYDIPPFGKMMEKGNLCSGNIIDFDTHFPKSNKKHKKIIEKATTFDPKYRYRNLDQFISDFLEISPIPKINKKKSLRAFFLFIILLCMTLLSINIFLLNQPSEHIENNQAINNYNKIISLPEGTKVFYDEDINKIIIQIKRTLKNVNCIDVSDNWSKVQFSLWLAEKYKKEIYAKENNNIITIKNNVNGRLSGSITAGTKIGMLNSGYSFNKISEQKDSIYGKWYEVEIVGFVKRPYNALKKVDSDSNKQPKKQIEAIDNEQTEPKAIANETTKNIDKNLSHLKSIENFLKMTFVYIQPGSFLMGTDFNKKDPDETPHVVELTQGFYMQTSEVTQGQWKAIMNNNPSYYSMCGDNCPVERVSWFDIQEFIIKLNKQDKRNNYSLPTEAQWEYAAKAETTSQFHWGDIPDCSKANFGNSSKTQECINNPGKTMEIKSFEANKWGLYDMHGNVNEWCLDCYADYSLINSVNPIFQNFSKSLNREKARKVVRGGGYNDKSIHCRSSNRIKMNPYNNDVDNLGFRLVINKIFRERE